MKWLYIRHIVNNWSKKMIEATLKAIYESKPLLEKLPTLRGMKAKSSYDLSKILKDSFEEIGIFDDIRLKKIREIGEPVMVTNPETQEKEPDKGGSYMVPMDKMPEFMGDVINPLLEKIIKFERTKLSPENFDNLTDKDGNSFTLSPEDFIVLGWLIE